MIDISLPVLQMDILNPMKTKDKKEVKKKIAFKVQVNYGGGSYRASGSCRLSKHWRYIPEKVFKSRVGYLQQLMNERFAP